MKKMGGMQGILSLLPGAQKIKKQMAVGGLDDKILVRMDSMISSMTSKEISDSLFFNLCIKDALSSIQLFILGKVISNSGL